jgi:hypothetical protein
VTQMGGWGGGRAQWRAADAASLGNVGTHRPRRARAGLRKTVTCDIRGGECGRRLALTEGHESGTSLSFLNYKVSSILAIFSSNEAIKPKFSVHVLFLASASRLGTLTQRTAVCRVCPSTRWAAVRYVTVTSHRRVPCTCPPTPRRCHVTTRWLCRGGEVQGALTSASRPL